MNSEKHNLVIIGAGVVGLSCAYKAKEILGENVEITIIAEKFLSETTTFGSGGLWEPYQIAGTPDESINKWGKIAFDHFLELYHGPYCGTAGVQLMNFYQLFRSDEKNISPSWKDIVFNFQQLSDAEILKMKLPPVYTSAYSFSTLVIEQKYYLTWLTNNLKSSGVKFIQKKILDLHELKGYDSIINCSGLGAYELMGDNSMYPIRGQVLRIKAPWIKNVWMFGSNYLIPNIDSIVVGGTQQKGDWNTIPSLEDTESILNNVCSLFPSLRDAQIETIWAGLRPGRTPLRLDSEVLTLPDCSRVPLIHCYGHGGSGVTLAMGCAHEVVIEHLLPIIKKERSLDNLYDKLKL